MPRKTSKKLERFYPRDRREWRQWLQKNHDVSLGVELVITKKHSGKPGVNYEEAIEEALSFGWIDSRANKLDEFGYLLHFSPRKPGSIWAKSNKLRVEKLTKSGSMATAGLRAVEESRRDGSWDSLNEVDELVIPADLAGAMAENPAANRHFQGFSDSLKRQILWWIKNAKRPETRARRIARVVFSAERHEKPV
jgi:uncharacterized protein YdeI (YjbR/CyaY-like superfamily)